MEPQDLTQPIGEDPAADPIEEQPVADAPSQADETPAPPKPPTVGQLRRERKHLWDQRQETTYHVGGLVVDLRRRAMLDDGLVAGRADLVLAMDARIREIDAQLADLDQDRRRGRVRMPAPQGYCLSCGAPYLADAVFCSRCGARIHVGAGEGETQVLAIADEGTT